MSRDFLSAKPHVSNKRVRDTLHLAYEVHVLLNQLNDESRPELSV